MRSYSSIHGRCGVIPAEHISEHAGYGETRTRRGPYFTSSTVSYIVQQANETCG